MKNIKILLKVYFNLDTSKEYFISLCINGYEGSSLDLDVVDEYITDNLLLSDIIYSNGPIYDFSVEEVKENIDFNHHQEFEFVEDPIIEIKKNNKIKKDLKIIEKFEKNLENYSIKGKDIKTNLEKGVFIVKNKAFDKVEIPIDSIFGLIEKDTNGDIILENSFDEKILELRHGSFLNSHLAEIQVFNNSEDKNKYSLLNNTSKGGIFIREDGRLDIGDSKSTKYLTVHLSALIKEMYVKKMIGKSKDFLNNIKFLE